MQVCKGGFPRFNQAQVSGCRLAAVRASGDAGKVLGRGRCGGWGGGIWGSEQKQREPGKERAGAGQGLGTSLTLRVPPGST